MFVFVQAANMIWYLGSPMTLPEQEHYRLWPLLPVAEAPTLLPRQRYVLLVPRKDTALSEEGSSCVAKLCRTLCLKLRPSIFHVP